MRAFVLSAVAAIAATAFVACSGGMQATPSVGSPGTVEAPSTRTAPESTDNSADNSADTSDDTADAPPITSSKPGTPSKPSGSSPGPHSPTPAPRAQQAFHPVCTQAASPGRRQCASIVRLQARGGCAKSAPYCAAALQSAYGVAQAARSRGRGVLVAIVDAFGYPAASNDLAVYRKSMGLAACTPSNGCLKIVNQSGRTTPLPKPNADASDDWRAEQAVDLQMASALCPNCKLLLVQANSDKNSDLAVGVNAAAALGAAAISNSYGSAEGGAADAAYSHAGRAITASSGDDGSANQPCSFTGVVCVGGTTLTAAGRGWVERGWRSSTSGCSALVAKPSWQHGRDCPMRSLVDASAVADPNTGVAFYESAGGGWQQAGGTGVAAPIVAALFALEPNSVRANAPAWLWRHGRKPPRGGT